MPGGSFATPPGMPGGSFRVLVMTFLDAELVGGEYKV
jgi:hypothetical protein